MSRWWWTAELWIALNVFSCSVAFGVWAETGSGWWLGGGVANGWVAYLLSRELD